MRQTMRRAFTLVELLVVVVVIAILIGLLVPAISGAIKATNAAKVTAEINNMATAMAQFKTTYSDYPPSRVLLHESGYYDTGSTTRISSNFTDVRSDITVGQLNQRTVRYLTKFFPRATCFATAKGVGSATEINGYVYGRPANPTGYTLTAGEDLYLDGAECLVFFLGGQTVANSQTQTSPPNGGGTLTGGSNLPPPVWGATGYGRNPVNPFYLTNGATVLASTSRTQPFFEFQSDRLIDLDGDGFPSYVDGLTITSQGRPYAYFSAYGSNSYDPNDCNADPHATNYNDVFAEVFTVNFTVEQNSYNSCLKNPPQQCASPAPNPYSSTGTLTGNNATTWQKPQTFQIISAGADQIFGIGGQFAGNNATDKLPFPDGPNGSVCGVSAPVDGGRNVENDNLSNFSNGRLNQ